MEIIDITGKPLNLLPNMHLFHAGFVLKNFSGLTSVD